MKIVHWDEMFHPTFGYQINVLSKFQARQGHEVIIVTSQDIEKHPMFSKFVFNTDIKEEDKKFTEEFNVKIIRLPIHGVVSGRVIFKKGFIKELKALNPDVILCHFNDTVSSMWIALRHKYINKPLVFDNHMLDMATKNPLSKLFRFFFKMCITPLIKKNKWKVIRTQDDEFINKAYGIPREQSPFMSFGSDTTLFYPNKSVRQNLREQYDISPEAFVVIYTGKLSESKGGLFMAESLEKKITDKREIVFVIVGNGNDDYGKQVEEKLSKSENRILRFPTQRYIDLPKYYQFSDLSIFPKQVSLSFFDAQASGLPVVSEENNINSERLKYNNGWTYKKNSMADFREKIKHFSEMSRQEFDEIKNNAVKYVNLNYDYENIAKDYTEILESELNRFKKANN